MNKESLGERLLDISLFFPKEITEKSGKRSVRVTGAILWLPWTFTLGIVFGVAGIFVMFCEMIYSTLREAWSGEPTQ